MLLVFCVLSFVWNGLEQTAGFVDHCQKIWCGYVHGHHPHGAVSVDIIRSDSLDSVVGFFPVRQANSDGQFQYLFATISDSVSPALDSMVDDRKPGGYESSHEANLPQEIFNVFLHEAPLLLPCMFVVAVLVYAIGYWAVTAVLEWFIPTSGSILPMLKR